MKLLIMAVFQNEVLRITFAHKKDNLPPNAAHCEGSQYAYLGS
jgi:hypothetical protein